MSNAIKIAFVVIATILLTGIVSYWITLMFQPDAVGTLVILAGATIGMIGAGIILEISP